MKQRLVSAAAVLFCGAVLAIVAVFGYTRYKASQMENEQFRDQLQNGTADQSGALAAHMPAQLPARPDGDAGGSPTPAGQ